MNKREIKAHQLYYYPNTAIPANKQAIFKNPKQAKLKSKKNKKLSPWIQTLKPPPPPHYKV